MASAQAAQGVYTSLAELVALQYAARGFSLLGRQPATSALAGRRNTRLRGRGLDFDELRVYQSGDDVRSIDWKVTARTGVPHTRVYRVERERPVLLVVDQRLAMFFGTQCQMKSVTAAELAAVIAWQVAAAGDRVGALVFGDEAHTEIEPRRSRSTVVRLLEALVEHNTALRVDGGLKPVPSQLNSMLEGVARRTTHDWIVVLISDFQGFDAASLALVRRISRHNDVIAALVHDARAVTLPTRKQVVLSDTHGQIQIHAGHDATRAGIMAIPQQRVERLESLRAVLALPFLSIHSGGQVAQQLRVALGFAQVSR